MPAGRAQRLHTEKLVGLWAGSLGLYRGSLPLTHWLKELSFVLCHTHLHNATPVW